MSEKKEEKKTPTRGRPKKVQSEPVVEETQEVGEDNTTYVEVPVIPKDLQALKDLLDKDKEHFEEIALERLKKEITTAVRAFADVAKTAQNLETLFDKQFSDKIYHTLLQYFDALYERVFPESFLERVDRGYDDSDHPRDYEVDEDGGEEEPRPVRPAAKTSKPSTPPVPVRRRDDLATSEMKTAAAAESINMSKVIMASSGSSGGGIDTVCLECGWEGSEAQCSKKRVGDFITISCPKCKNMLG